MNRSVLHVTWLDASATSSWSGLTDREVTEELRPTHSVGFLISENETSLILALTFDPSTETINAYMHIPLCCIIDVREICSIPMTS